MKTYTFQEFAYLQKKRKMNFIDKGIEHIKKNEMLYKQLVVTLALIGFITNTSFASGENKIDAAGNRILVVVRRIGYWVILIKCISELIKNAMNGDIHGVGRTVMLYVIIYGCLFFVPWALRLVEGVF